MEEVWEIDREGLTLNDFKFLQEIAKTGVGVQTDVDALIAVLDRLIVNKTAEEIGNLPIRDLDAGFQATMKSIEELTIPKESTTP